MKYITLLSAGIFICAVQIGVCQKPSLELTFTAEYNSHYVQLDSIYIKNLTQGTDTVLYYPDTMLVFDYLIGFPEYQEFNTSDFFVLQNRPNPFSEETLINVSIPEDGDLSISIINMLGQTVAAWEKVTNKGNHTFVFYPGIEHYYIFSARYNGNIRSTKMVSLKDHHQPCALDYRGFDPLHQTFKNYQGKQQYGFTLGDQLRFIGYAKNPLGIPGSDVIEDAPEGNENYVFKIIEGLPCPETPTVNYDGLIYKTLQIGMQCWFKENLNVGTIIPGTQNQTNNGILEKYCYDNLESNCDEFGGLYQWDEIMQYSTQQGVRGICPENWHLPTDEEWTILTDYVTSRPDYWCNENSDWLAKSLASTTNWLASTGICTVGNDLTANNATGFAVYPGGHRSTFGEFVLNGWFGFLWSSTEYLEGIDGRSRYIYSPHAYFYRSSHSKDYGFSVRCINNPQNLPDVTTAIVTDITETTATCGGEVINGGGSAIFARGVCWSTLPEPTINGYHTSDGTGTGVFVSNISGLTPNTLYYIRAYGTNYLGTSYGDESTFITIAEVFNCGDMVVYQGQNYNTISIGSQCWIKENINVGTMIWGNVNQTNNGIIEKYCYNNNPSNCATYGGLYQWEEMMQYQTIVGSRGICPINWHLPSDSEWMALMDYTQNQSNYLCDSNPDFIAKSFASMYYWNVSNNICAIGNNLSANNATGFSSLPAGYRTPDGDFLYLNDYGYWWCSSQYSITSAWRMSMFYSNPKVFLGFSNKDYGKSVRCLKNPNTTIPTVTTKPVINITQTTAQCGGVVIDAGGLQVTQRGICWSTTPVPTINNDHTWNGSGIGEYISLMSGLSSNIIYYVRAYATNSEGTAYGNMVTFTTSSSGFVCGDSVNYGGQNYGTILLGSRCWFKENLNIGIMIEGSMNQSDNGVIEKYCNNDDPENCTIYGGLYQWDEMMHYTLLPGGQGICPDKWHVPSHSDWSSLESFISSQPWFLCNGNTNYIAKALAETLFWSPNTLIFCAIGNNLSVNNKAGFTGRPGGNRYHANGSFALPGNIGLWWTSTHHGNSYAKRRGLLYSDATVIYNYSLRNYGFSVRCIRD